MTSFEGATGAQMYNEHILIVEDESKIADLLRDYLSRAGYGVSCLDVGGNLKMY